MKQKKVLEKTKENKRRKKLMLPELLNVSLPPFPKSS